MKKHFFYTIVIIAIALIACNKEDKFTTSSGDMLEFSLDTLRFDTVFTELGSATRFIKVYNRHKESIRISRVALGEGANSKFRLNVDGIPTNDETGDIIIFPEDSIYIFGEVTINPDDPLSISPFVIHDEIIFETNGNDQRVTLEAWGQNANYIPSRYHKDSIEFLPCNGDIIWDDPKPYVVYGIIVIESCKLTIAAGTRVHVHGGISQGLDESDDLVVYNSGRIFIGPNGQIEVNGTLEDPVIIQGDRLEEGFEETSGQWTGIIIGKGSRNNSFEHAIVKNSLFGIFADSASELSLKNTQIYNTGGVGLAALHASVVAENSLFYNNNATSVFLGYGGNYNFDYCTIASYGVDAAALNLDNVFCYDQFCQDFDVNPLVANFYNCIVFGSRRDEVNLADFSGGQTGFFSYHFENCIVRVDELLDEESPYKDFLDNCNNCINGVFSDTLFFDVNEDDYHLDTLSIAEEMAIPLNGIGIDLEGNERDMQNPDIGCFEYQHQ